ncbi:MAG: transcription factor S [Candidatus Thorarchaeota archaeon]
MEFCEKCGAMMAVSTTDDGHRVLKCRSCGAVKTLDQSRGEMSVTRRITKTPRDKIVIVEDDQVPMPTTTAVCEKCGNRVAYYWTVQTRRADEGSTEFYRCTKCKHTWRYYGGR